MARSNVVLTEGSIWKKIVIFAIPLFFGNLFQQLYNLSDSFIVSQFAGEKSFGAITTTGSFVFFFVGFFMGLSTGAGVTIAKYVGAKDNQNVRLAIHTDMAMGLVASLLVSLIGVGISPFLLRWLQVPDELYNQSLVYVIIYFGGAITVVMYNICMGIMQAMGDSRHPLYYLIVSSIANVLLDLLFVGLFKWGVAGAATATILSQGLSVVLCLFRMYHVEEISFRWKEIKFTYPLLKQMLYIGLPAAIQNSIIAIANMVVQSNINSFGEVATIGSGSYAKIEGFAFLPVTCFSLSMTTFIGQNLGAKQYQRAKKGALFGIVCAIVLAEIIGLAFYLLSPVLIPIFAKSPESIAIGIKQAKVESLFFFLLAFTHVASAVLRGAGKSFWPMFIMFACWCGIRILYVTITLIYIPNIAVIFSAYPITWGLSSIILVILLMFSNWIHGLEK